MWSRGMGCAYGIWLSILIDVEHDTGSLGGVFTRECDELGSTIVDESISADCRIFGVVSG